MSYAYDHESSTQAPLVVGIAN